MRAGGTTQAWRSPAVIAAALLTEFMLLTTFDARVVVTFVLFCGLALAALLMVIETTVGAAAAGIAVAALTLTMYRDFHVERDGSASGEVRGVVSLAEAAVLAIRRRSNGEDPAR